MRAQYNEELGENLRLAILVGMLPKEIQEMVNPLVNNADIGPTMLALLAYADLKKGSKRTAKAHFQKAKDLGLKVGHINRVLATPSQVDDFFTFLSDVGIIE